MIKKEQGIILEQYTVGYGKKIIVKDISFTVRPGEILTIIGPNGAGKSTILKTITGQLKNMDGVAYLDGRSMEEMKEHEIAQSMSMVMTQKISPELMKCRDIVATGRYPYTGKLGILTKEDWVKVEHAIGLVHADEVADRDFNKISDGQKQRVMLARAICQETNILILDEPTSYLDMHFKLDILENIRRLAREKNIAVVMSLHELDLAKQVSDRIACVNKNKIERIGTPLEIFCDNYIQELYGISEKCFDPLLGTMYLRGNRMEPKVFVIGGGGSGIPIYQRLQRENTAFAAGILAKNDMEYSIANALASRIVFTDAFCPILEEQILEAERLIDQCENCICTLNSFALFNQENRILMDYADSKGKLL